MRNSEQHGSLRLQSTERSLLGCRADGNAFVEEFSRSPKMLFETRLKGA